MRPNNEANPKNITHPAPPDPRTASDLRRHPALAPAIAILGVPFDHVTLREAVRRIGEMIATQQPHYVITANVDFLVQARKDPHLHRIMVDAHLVLCDGMPLVWASRWLGNPLPERVAGADLAPELLRTAAEKKYRLFFLGASPAANRQAVLNVKERFPGIQIVGSHSPSFKSWSKFEQKRIAERVRAARPDILLVAFGCPKAEKWIAAHYRELGVPVTMGVGATLDFLAGHMKRAPHWMRRSGAEWIYRMWQEPRRLFRRYVTDIWAFMREIPLQWWRMKPPRNRRPIHTYTAKPWKPEWRRIRAPARLDVEIARQSHLLWKHMARHNLLLDLAGVEVIDSTGVGLLLQLRRQARADGRKLVLLSPSRAVRRALAYMRVQDCFAISGRAAQPLSVGTA